MEKPISRRSTLQRTLVAAAAAALGCGPARTGRAQVAEAQKVSQADAKYRPTPNGQQRCEICLQFKPPNQCNIVQGPISATGWCQFFAARENAH